MARYSQDNFSCRLTSPLGEDLLLSGFRGEESISSLFRFELDLYSEEPDLSAEDVVGRTMSIELDVDRGGEGGTRWFQGIVSRFTFASTHASGYSYRADLVPWTWLLKLSSGCRIFQELNALEVAREVISDYDSSVFETAISPADHATRAYCVQYRESDLEFLSRLFEQEGWFWFFRHDSEGHALVLSSADLQSSDCPEMEENMRFAPGGDEPHDAPYMVSEWLHEQALHANTLSIADYNYEDPRTRLLVTRGASDSFGAEDPSEDYDYPGEFDKLGEPDGAKLDYGDEWVRLRMLAREAAAVRVAGKCGNPMIAPGVRFNLVNHGRADENDLYLVTSAQHEFSQPVEGTGEGGSYQNRFRCIPASVRYVPRPTARRPFIRGPQTAVVVGEEEAEPGDVRIDSQGRVKVRFHWDRSESEGGDTSCWLRVAQDWAGAAWGIQYHPRVGHEVVVSFLEGDPDRPLVTGRVYNAVNEIPYPEPTQGGIKTRSTPDGTPETFNEIRFEDAKDEEEIYLQAEKDLRILVKNDESKEIGENRTETVGTDVTIQIGKNRQKEVGENQTETIGKKKSVSVGGNHEETVDGKMTLTVKKSRNVSIGGDSKIRVDGDSGQQVKGDEKTEIDKNSELAIQKDYSVTANKITIEAKNEITLKVGPASIKIDKMGNITCDGMKVAVQGSAGVALKGAKVDLN